MGIVIVKWLYQFIVAKHTCSRDSVGNVSSRWQNIIYYLYIAPIEMWENIASRLKSICNTVMERFYLCPQESETDE